jgi:phage tail tape-measure protein
VRGAGILSRTPVLKTPMCVVSKIGATWRGRADVAGRDQPRRTKARHEAPNAHREKRAVGNAYKAVC